MSANFKRILIICFIVKFNVLAIEIPDSIREAGAILHKMCREESGVEERIIQENKHGDLADIKELKCYIHCIFRQINVIDSEGHINFQNIYYLLPTEVKGVVDQITKHCNKIKGDNECETAWLTAKCYFKADPGVAKITEILE